MASPLFVAAGAVGSVPSVGNGAVALAAPAGVQEGDLLILFVMTGNSATASVLGAPSGFTKVTQINSSSFVAGGHYWGKLAGGSEASTYSVSETAATVQSRACICAWRGVDQVTPINASAQSARQTSTASISVPSVTATVDETTLVAIVFEDNARSLTISGGGALTARQAQTTAGRSFLIADEPIATAGTISGRTATSSATGDFYAMAFAIAPDSAGGSPPSGTVTITLADVVLAASGTVATNATGTIAVTLAGVTMAASGVVASADGTITTEPLKNNTGTVLASETGVTVHVYETTGELVVTKIAQTTDADGIMAITDALIEASTEYRIVIVLGSGAEGMDRITAA